MDAPSPHDDRRGGLTLAQVNKVHHVHTIARVAEMLGEDVDWLREVAIEMDQEDGLIWVYGPGDESVMAFTDFGIDTLTGLVQIYKVDPDLLVTGRFGPPYGGELRRLIYVVSDVVIDVVNEGNDAPRDFVGPRASPALVGR